MTKIEVENVLQPGKVYRVDAEKFAAMREAVLTVVPQGPPGMTPEEIIAAVRGAVAGEPVPRRREGRVVGQVGAA